MSQWGTTAYTHSECGILVGVAFLSDPDMDGAERLRFYGPSHGPLSEARVITHGSRSFPSSARRHPSISGEGTSVPRIENRSTHPSPSTSTSNVAHLLHCQAGHRATAARNAARASPSKQPLGSGAQAGRDRSTGPVNWMPQPEGFTLGTSASSVDTVLDAAGPRAQATKARDKATSRA